MPPPLSSCLLEGLGKNTNSIRKLFAIQRAFIRNILRPSISPIVSYRVELIQIFCAHYMYYITAKRMICSMTLLGQIVKMT